MMYGTPPKLANPALLRASGRAGPCVQGWKLPSDDTVVTSTWLVAVLPSLPPTRYRWEPDCTASIPVRGAGNASSSGFGCHGITVPGGAGHGILAAGTLP